MRHVIFVVIWILLVFTRVNQSTYAQEYYHRITGLSFPNVTDIEWSPDGDRLAIVDFPSIHILDTTSWESILTIPDAEVSQVVWNSKGTQIASVAGGNPGSLFIRDVDTSEIVTHLTIHHGDFKVNVVLPMFKLAWSPDDNQIASDSYAGDVLIWNLNTAEVNILGSHTQGRVGEVDWNSQSNRVVSVAGDRAIRIWDVASRENLLTIEGSGSVDWHPTDDKIVANVSENKVAILNSDSGQEIMSFEHESRIVLSRWNFDGELIATGDMNGVISIWEAQTGKRIGIIEELSNFPVALMWNPNNNLLAGASYNGEVYVWEIAD